MYLLVLAGVFLIFFVTYIFYSKNLGRGMGSFNVYFLTQLAKLDLMDGRVLSVIGELVQDIDTMPYEPARRRISARYAPFDRAIFPTLLFVESSLTMTFYFFFWK